MLKSQGVPNASRTLFKTALPFILPSSGTMANNGAITLTTALPVTYAQAYVYLPASAISAGSAAGWYYATFSSATVGTVFNNTYTSGQPKVPTSPTAFVTTGPGAFTQILTEQFGPTLSMPGGTMGIRDTLRIVSKWTMNASANLKIMRTYLGATSFHSRSQAGATIKSQGFDVPISNRDSLSSQIGGYVNADAGTSSGAQGINYTTGTINTAVAQNVQLSLQLAAATDFCIIEEMVAELWRSPV